ncbi:MAG: hypothetical protein RRY34_02260 [Victivallaceae bacterium]
MEHQRRSKKIIIFEELIQKIKSGSFPPGGEFLTTEELVQLYGISSGTAGKIIQGLHEENLLAVSRGRRSVVMNISNPPAVPQLSKPVGLVHIKATPLNSSRWRDKVLYALQRQLLDDGNQPMWLPDNVKLPEISNNYSGIIYPDELAFKCDWKFLLEQNIPCSKLSFLYPSPNTLFIDFRGIFDQITLHMMHHKCKKVFQILESLNERDLCAKWTVQKRFLNLIRFYGLSEADFKVLILEDFSAARVEQLRSEFLRNNEKFAILANNCCYNNRLIDLLGECKLKMYEDYQLYTLNYIDDELPRGNNVDMPYEELANRLLEIFYNHCRSGHPQVGQCFEPKFIPGKQ